jgi:glycosyltransferase involved in cell wall biosynthesis
MKILYVTLGFPPYQFGGTEQLSYLLAARMAREKDVSVAVFSGGLPRRFDGEYKEEEENGIRIRRVKSFSQRFLEAGTPLVELDTYKNEVFENLFERFAREVAPEIIHFQHTIRLSTSLIPRARNYAKKVVVSLQDFWYVCPRIHLLKPDNTMCLDPLRGRACYSCRKKISLKGVTASLGNRLRKRSEKKLASRFYFRIKRELQKKRRTGNSRKKGLSEFLARYKYVTEALNSADHILSPSVFLRDAYRRFNVVEGAKITAIPLGVAPFGTKEKGDLTRPIRFGYAGSPMRHKGASLLFRAFSTIDPKETKLIIWGSGWEDWPQQGAKSKNVIFKGKYGRETLGTVFNSFDALIIPSLWGETFSFIAHEAFFAGVPVIASNVGVFPDIISPGRNGLLFEVNNFNSLRKQIDWILDDPERLKAMSAKIGNVKTDKEFADEIFRFYMKILNDG